MDEIYHHGIKGQKWGVRRYQNADGTLTAAGKKRYMPSGTINDFGQREKTSREKEFEKQRGINPNLERKRHPGAVSITGDNSHKEIPGEIVDGVRKKTSAEKHLEKVSTKHNDPKSMSDEELRQKIARKKLEKQYRDLEADEVNSGKKYAEGILKDIGKQTLTKVGASVATGLLLYGAKVAITKKVDLDELGDAVFNGGPKKKK